MSKVSKLRVMVLLGLLLPFVSCSSNNQRNADTPLEKSETVTKLEKFNNTPEPTLTTNSYTLPELGIYFNYPNDFVVREYDYSHTSNSLSILQMEDAESGAGMLPEIFVNVYENSSQTSLDEWIEKHNVEDELPFYSLPDFTTQQKINNIDVIYFTTHDSMFEMDSQLTLFETANNEHIVEIGYIQLQQAPIARAYWQVIESIGLE